MSSPSSLTGLSEFRDECARRGLTPEEGRAFMQRLRARTRLLSELADAGLSTRELADVATGVRPVAQVLAEHDSPSYSTTDERNDDQ